MVALPWMRPGIQRYIWALAVVAALAVASTDAVRVVAQQFVNPPPGDGSSDHCECRGGICPIGANGRGCSCGCLRKADAQAAQPLAAEFDEPCRGGRAGGYPCRGVDLLAFLPLEDIGGGTAN